MDEFFAKICPKLDSDFFFMQSNVSGDKIVFMTEALCRGNRMRYCALIFFALIPCMSVIKGIGGFLDMTITGLLMGFMMRNIDAVWARLLKGTGNSPAGVVSFLLPVAMTTGLGAILDSFVVLSAIINQVWTVWLAVWIIGLAVRIVVCATTLPLARMVMDPNYHPAGGFTNGLLVRQELEEAAQEPAFRPFSGSAFTTSAS